MAVVGAAMELGARFGPVSERKSVELRGGKRCYARWGWAERVISRSACRQKPVRGGNFALGAQVCEDVGAHVCEPLD